MICEAVNQAVFQIMADDLAVTLAAQAGQLELNAFLPLIAKNLFDMIDLLDHVLTLFIDRCIKGIQANMENCSHKVAESYILATAFTGYIGYDQACKVAILCQNTGMTVREIVLERQLLDEKTLDELLKPESLTSPGRVYGKEKKQWRI